MATNEVQVKVQVASTELQAMIDRLKASFPEERIRRIVREELAQLMMKPSIHAPGYQQYEVK